MILKTRTIKGNTCNARSQRPFGNQPPYRYRCLDISGIGQRGA
jgi:hypothetical protein